MINNTLRVVVVVAAVCMCGDAMAQISTNYAVPVAPNSYSGGSFSEGNCGRGITQSEAAGLWADYCTENCGMGDRCGRRCGCGLFNHCGGGCGLFGKHSARRACDSGCETVCEEPVVECCAQAAAGCGCLSGLKARLAARKNACDTGCETVCEEPVAVDCCGEAAAGCGCLSGLKARLAARKNSCGGGAACGCDMGCFGYPSGCGCETGCSGKLRGLFHRDHGCGCEVDPCDSGCGCGGKLRGLFHRHNGCGCGCEVDPCDSGCGCGGKLRGLFSCGLFKRNRACCGDPCGYFNEAVGPEYGTAGMQSCVAGCGAVAPSAPMPAASTDANASSGSAAEAAVEELKQDAGEN